MAAIEGHFPSLQTRTLAFQAFSPRSWPWLPRPCPSPPRSNLLPLRSNPLPLRSDPAPPPSWVCLSQPRRLRCRLRRSTDRCRPGHVRMLQMRAHQPWSCPICIKSALSLPMSAPGFAANAREDGGSASETAKSTSTCQNRDRKGQDRSELHLLRGGLGQERSGPTQLCSGRGPEFAARSGFSRSGNCCKPCAVTVSADATSQKRGMARLPGERSRPEPATARVCAGQPAPRHGPARSGCFVHASNLAPTNPALTTKRGRRLRRLFCKPAMAAGTRPGCSVPSPFPACPAAQNRIAHRVRAHRWC
jgi:hypothetical protein